MIDVHDPQVMVKLNQRAESDFDGLVKELRELAERSPGEFVLLMLAAGEEDDQ